MRQVRGRLTVSRDVAHLDFQGGKAPPSDGAEQVSGGKHGFTHIQWSDEDSLAGCRTAAKKASRCGWGDGGSFGKDLSWECTEPMEKAMIPNLGRQRKKDP